jgi:heme A synthase
VSAWLRQSVYVSLGALWLTGCGWLVLHYFFQSQGDFGPAPHPWQPPLLVVHGVLAAAATFLVGWISGVHVGERWGRRSSRTSGLILLALLGLLILTGVGIYYAGWETARNVISALHELAGAFVIVPALLHWLSKRNGNRAQ